MCDDDDGDCSDDAVLCSVHTTYILPSRAQPTIFYSMRCKIMYFIIRLCVANEIVSCMASTFCFRFFIMSVPNKRQNTNAVNIIPKIVETKISYHNKCNEKSLIEPWWCWCLANASALRVCISYKIAQTTNSLRARSYRLPHWLSTERSTTKNWAQETVINDARTEL